MNKELHSQKLDILARLIKADHLSLAEALVLLENEEVKEESPVIQSPGSWSPPTWVYPPTLGDNIIFTPGTAGPGWTTVTPGSGLTASTSGTSITFTTSNKDNFTA